ncbi:MAG TPA: AgmX/PglI C-terminal domain-containing protein [Polyangiaceae bacterium]|nr:AgmX/PglI C-terminal domain-containing protein [Polyangiaceae bacterium]
MNPKSSLPPAGVPGSGGNAKYGIVALVLFLGIGGLVWRIMSGRSEQAPAPAPSVAMSVAPPSNPRLDDVPPPPPPEDKPEAGPAGPRIVYVQAGGCEGKCVGKAPPELYQAVQVRGMQARRCYNQALSRDSSLKGHVSVNVRIGPTGNICSATVASNDMGTPNVAECAANIFRNVGGYPSPRGGCVEMNVPLSFVPQGQ